MPEHELTIGPKVFCGKRERYGCATDVEFIDDNHLVSIAFNSRMMYQIALLPNGLYQIIDQQIAKHFHDTMDYKDGLLLTADFPHNMPHGYASVYEYEHGKFRLRKELQMSNTKSHGATIVDNNTIIITSNSDHNRGLLFVDLTTNSMTRFDNFKFYPKDTCIYDGKLFITSSASLPFVGKEVEVLSSTLYVFDLASMEKIDELPFHGQTDSLAFDGEDGFVTLQSEDCLLHFKFENNKLSFVKFIGGFSFPHGIDIHNGRVAVTNYGDNTIRVFDKAELIA